MCASNFSLLLTLNSFKYLKCVLLFEEDVILRTHAHRGTDDVHISSNVSSIDEGSARCRREQASQDGPGKQ